MNASGLSVLDGYVRRQHLGSDIIEYLPLLYGYVRLYKSARVQEIGTRTGNSTLAFLAAAEVVGGHVWSVDIDRDVPGNPNGMGPFRHSPLWTFTCGDSIDPGVAGCQPEQIDVLFIDSEHGFVQTLAELRTYAPRLVAGGTALLHDTRLAFDNYGVRHALDDYCAERNLVWHDLPGDYGLGVFHAS